MAIGVKKNHIFQGIIYSQPRHKSCKVANLEYRTICKELWRLLSPSPNGGVEPNQAVGPGVPELLQDASDARLAFPLPASAKEMHAGSAASEISSDMGLAG